MSIESPVRLVDTDFVMTIDGEAVTSDRRSPVFNPATGQEFASVPVATREDLDRAVDAAAKAFVSWSVMPLAQRQAAVSAIGDRLEQHAEDFMALLTKETGQAPGDGGMGGVRIDRVVPRDREARVAH